MTDSPPTWMTVSMSVLTCVLPIALVILYWIGRVKCDRVIALTVGGCVLASVMALVWFGIAYNKMSSSVDA